MNRVLPAGRRWREEEGIKGEGTGPGGATWTRECPPPGLPVCTVQEASKGQFTSCPSFGKQRNAPPPPPPLFLKTFYGGVTYVQM